MRSTSWSSTSWRRRRATRIDCLHPATSKVRPGGYLLLDDSDRPGYAEAFELLASWRFRRFVGVKDGWPEACETGIFRRHQKAPLPGPSVASYKPDSSGAAIHLCGPLWTSPGRVRGPAWPCTGRGLPRACVTAAPVRSYRTVSSLPVRGSRVPRHRRSVLCGTFPRVSRVGVTHRPCPVVSGLSSKACTSATA